MTVPGTPSQPPVPPPAPAPGPAPIAVAPIAVAPSAPAAPPAPGPSPAPIQGKNAPGKGPTPPPPPPRRTPPRPPRPPKSSSGVAGAYLFSFIALIIALVAVAGAAYAWKTARDATQTGAASPTPTAEATTASATPTVALTDLGGSPTAGTSFPPSAVWVPEDFPQPVEIAVQPPSSCENAYIDVDTGTTGLSSAQYHELYFNVCQGTLRLHLDRTSGRSAVDAGVTATADLCGSLVAGTPTTELVLDALPGVEVCLLTNQADAAAQSLPQRLAIVQVLAVAPEIKVSLYLFHRAA